MVFHKESVEADRAEHMRALRASIDAEAEGASSVSDEYAFKDFFGYAAKLSPAVLDKVRADASVVEFVEQDQVMRTSAPAQAEVERPLQCQMQLEATWGLVRTGSRALDINGEYAYNFGTIPLLAEAVKLVRGDRSRGCIQGGEE